MIVHIIIWNNQFAVGIITGFEWQIEKMGGHRVKATDFQKK